MLAPILYTAHVFCRDEAPIHLDRGYESAVTHERRAARGLHGEIAPKGTPAPIATWNNAHKKLVWCTERRARVVAFWPAFSAVVIIVRRLIREGWSRYRRDDRPPCKP